MSLEDPVKTQSDLNSMSYPDDEVSLAELISAIWAGKWIVIFVSIVFAFGSIFYALSKPNIYKAKALLAPSSSGASGSLSSMARQFGGIASLAGISLGASDSGDKTTLAIEVIKSRQFITDFIRRYDLLVPLMAAKNWNSDSGVLSIDPELYDVSAGRWVREVDPPSTPEPSMWEAYKRFKDGLSVSRDRETGLVSVSVQFLSPQVAKEWVEWLVRDLNSEMKRKDVSEAERSILFLTEQLNNTEVTEMQNVFYQLIEEQTKTIMLSEVREEYVFSTIDPAIVPEEKSEPKRAIMVIIGTFMGGILGCFVVLIRYLRSS